MDLEDLPFQELGHYLGRLFLQLAKPKTCELYPTCLIMRSYNACNHVLHRAQVEQISLVGKHEPDINMLCHPFFIATNKAMLQALRMSRNNSVNKPRREVETITFERKKKNYESPVASCCHSTWCAK